MALTPGTRLGTYDITAQIGEGGMGQVYRAIDTRLKRQVALKVIPASVAADVERLARFQREAEVLASLNHPNIAGLYGVEDTGGVTALVMELVEGEDLSQRIARGAIALDEALPIAKQIADALEAAHDQGIVHRDLKPANIKVRSDGTVKVLDFGLAKAMEPAAVTSPGKSLSPTITTPAMTQAGVILGTAAYMSPEQANGNPADKRSDIWAFGCVLYEMLTGARAFGGDDVADTLASVLKEEPDWNALPAEVPPAVRTLIKGCLERDRQQRISDVAAVKFVLRNPSLGARTADVVGRAAFQPAWRRAIPVAAIAAAVGALGIIVGRAIQPALPPQRVTRFTYTLPSDQRFTEIGGQILAISPDGSHIAYIANRRIYLKPLFELDARPVAGTEAREGDVLGLTSLLFSPDGQSIAFWQGNLQDSAFKRVPLGGGGPVTLAQVPPTYLFMPTWRADGLLVGELRNGIVRFTTNGRRDLLVKATEGMLAAPQILPDGDTLLYVIAPGSEQIGAPPDTWDKAKIVIHSLKSGQEKTLVDGGGAPTYVPTGHLLYVVGGTLFAVPFDYRRREVTGGAVSVVEGVARPTFTNAAPPTVYYRVSDNGTLIYVPGPASLATAQFELAFVSVDGRVEPLKLRPGSYLSPRLSPDGKHVAFGTEDGKGANVWIYDLSGTAAARPLTLAGKNRYPVWSNDGSRVAFQSDREGDLAVFAQRADGSVPAERLTRASSNAAQIPESWSPDGRTLLYSQSNGAEFELWGLSLPEKRSFRFGDVRSSDDPTSAMFSPDGKSVAYLRTDNGTRTVFVEPFPSNGVKHPIGTGIWHPVWSADGTQLFYRGTAAREYAIRVTTQPSFSVSDPELVASTPFQSRGRLEREYDVTRDGRFIGIVLARQSPGAAAAVPDARPPNGSAFGTAQQINVVVNWTEELKQRVPAK